MIIMDIAYYVLPIAVIASEISNVHRFWQAARMTIIIASLLYRFSYIIILWIKKCKVCMHTLYYVDESQVSQNKAPCYSIKCNMEQ